MCVFNLFSAHSISAKTVWHYRVSIDVSVHVPFSPVEILEHRHFGFMDVSAQRYFNTFDIRHRDVMTPLGCFGLGIFLHCRHSGTGMFWHGDFSTP